MGVGGGGGVRKEMSGTTSRLPPLKPPWPLLEGDKVFQSQRTKHNFKDVSEAKDGKVLLILCNPIGL